jgi:hypothetical protein
MKSKVSPVVPIKFSVSGTCPAVSPDFACLAIDVVKILSTRIVEVLNAGLHLNSTKKLSQHGYEISSPGGRNGEEAV